MQEMLLTWNKGSNDGVCGTGNYRDTGMCSLRTLFSVCNSNDSCSKNFLCAYLGNFGEYWILFCKRAVGFGVGFMLAFWLLMIKVSL